MPELEDFQTHRPALFAVAYRMLGSATDAEDVLQDAWLRYSGARAADVRSAKAYLTTIVTRLCLDRLKSARASRAKSTSVRGCRSRWPTDTASGPERSLAQAESVTLAFMVLLETLSPEERAVFLLREVFDYEYDEIAGMLGCHPGELPPAVPPRQGANRRTQTAVPRRRRQKSGRWSNASCARSATAIEDGLTQVLAATWGSGATAAGRCWPRAGRYSAASRCVNMLVGFRRVGAFHRRPARVGIAGHRRRERRAGDGVARRRPARRRLHDEIEECHRRHPRRAEPDKLTYIDRQLASQP